MATCLLLSRAHRTNTFFCDVFVWYGALALEGYSWEKWIKSWKLVWKQNQNIVRLDMLSRFEGCWLLQIVHLIFWILLHLVNCVYLLGRLHHFFFKNQILSFFSALVVICGKQQVHEDALDYKAVNKEIRYLLAQLSPCSIHWKTVREQYIVTFAI